MNITVNGDFLWLPIQRNSSAVKLHFLSDGIKFQEIDISLCQDHPDYYAAMDLLHLRAALSAFTALTIPPASGLSTTLPSLPRPVVVFPPGRHLSGVCRYSQWPFHHAAIFRVSIARASGFSTTPPSFPRPVVVFPPGRHLSGGCRHSRWPFHHAAIIPGVVGFSACRLHPRGWWKVVADPESPFFYTSLWWALLRCGSYRCTPRRGRTDVGSPTYFGSVTTFLCLYDNKDSVEERITKSVYRLSR